MQKISPNNKLLYLLPDALLTHPKNLRRFYPDEQVRAMAESIRAAKGVWQAMQIVPNGTKGKYLVVDGNIRLAGGRLLGKDCPPLKCEPISASEAEQLLTMLITAKFRYDVDPVSEALHYKRLKDEEGYTVPQISRETGIHATSIYNRLEILKLDPEIQELIGKHNLPADLSAVRAFLSVPNPTARIKLAQRLARDGVTIKSIAAACEKLNAHLEWKGGDNSKGSPSLVLGKKRGKVVPLKTPVKWKQVRKAAAAMCENCDIRLSVLESASEPAWSLIVHAAEETCQSCNIRAVRGSCLQCPGVDIIHRLTERIGK